VDLYKIHTVRISLEPGVGFELVIGTNADDYIAHGSAPAQPSLPEQ
jgi:hypothetical protein